jgi:2-oxo-hept-3-ene-1,7-dioate hydratase
MGEDLSGPNAQIYDVLRATEFIQPALEIIDYRTELPRQICDTIADNAASGGMVIGGRTIRPFDVDLRWVGATLSQNGVIEETGLAAGIMGHPAAGVAWLVKKLNEVGRSYWPVPSPDRLQLSPVTWCMPTTGRWAALGCVL